MKIRVKVNDAVYQVEIENLNTRPIIARIGEQTFEIWPEVEAGSALAKPGPVEASPKPTTGLPSDRPTHERSVPAPLPGTVTEIMVSPGSQVQVGDSLLVIEAMKMKNTIRAARAGTIKEIHVVVGQSVQHKQLLLEFEA
jgi:biotin carboxyl carrier protein